MVVSVWTGVKGYVGWHIVVNRDREYTGCGGACRPMRINLWDNHLPLSLIWIIEQQTPVLQLAWAT